MQRLIIYQGENGQQFNTKHAAEVSLIRSIESRLNKLHVARNNFYNHKTHAEKLAFIKGVQGETGRTIAQWCEQLAELANDLNELEWLE